MSLLLRLSPFWLPFANSKLRFSFLMPFLALSLVSFRILLRAWARMVVVLDQWPAHAYLEDARWSFVLVTYHYVVLLTYFDVPHSLVQACVVTAVEDHHMVLSFGIPAVWLSFLACAVPAVSWTPDSCHLAGMIDAVACDLSSSSASTLVPFGLIDSVPWACLPHPWVVSPWLDRHSVRWACLSPSWVDVVCLMAVFVGWVVLLLLLRIIDRFRALALML